MLKAEQYATDNATTKKGVLRTWKLKRDSGGRKKQNPNQPNKKHFRAQTCKNQKSQDAECK